MHVTGTLNSKPNTDYTVELFASAACDPSGFGQGSTYLGDTTVHTDGSGNGSFSGTVANGSGVATATVTGPEATSEFSGCVEISSSTPQTFVVNSKDDHNDGLCDASDCTLREAVLAAADNVGPDTIHFDIPGGGLQTIPLTSSLPDIGSSLTIDGTSEPGTPAGHPGIELTDAGSGVWAMRLTGGQSTIRGLIINGYAEQIALTGGAGHTIVGNYLATNATTTSTNGGQGVNIDGANDSVIGGTAAADRNIIGGTGMGVEVAAGTDNVIEGNYIGVAPDGTTRISNAVNGIGLDSDRTMVGGTAAGSGNVIAVDTNGITIGGGDIASNNVIEGNSIGTTAGEAQVLPEDIGIDLESGQNNEIGVDPGTGTSSPAAPTLVSR